MDTVASLTDTLLLHLAWTSIQATLLIGLLWLLGRVLPRLPSPTRCLLWWLLGAQLLVGLAWQAPVSLPLLPPAHVTATATATPNVPIQVTGTSPAVSPINRASTNTTGPAGPVTWRGALVALWLAGLLVQLALVARQWERTRRIRHRSKPLDDPRLQAICADHAQRLGLRHCPELRVSDAIDSPQVTGLWRPTVLLPARTTLTPAEQAMALAHELAHVRRGDLWLGWIPALAKGLFFFHPLVRLAVHEYALHREAACDGQALRLQETAPRDYGHLLMHLGVARPASAGLTGVASPSFQQLKRRLAMLQHAAGAMPRPRDWLLVALIALAFVMPYRIVAADPAAHNAHRSAPSGTATFIKPPPPAAPQASASRIAQANSATQCGVAADNTTFCGANFLIYEHSMVQGQGVVLFDKRHVIIHGSPADVIASHHFYQPNEGVLWFRRGDKAYVSRNKQVVARAWQAYLPLMKGLQQNGALADKQSGLAGKQSRIASQQATFARKQAALASQRAALARKRASLAQKQVSEARREMAPQRVSTGNAATAATNRIESERQTIASRQHALDAQAQALNAQREQLSQQRAKLDAELDRKRQALHAQRTELAKQRHGLATHRKQSAAQTRAAMQRLLDDVLAKGLATPVSHD